MTCVHHVTNDLHSLNTPARSRRMFGATAVTIAAAAKNVNSNAHGTSEMKPRDFTARANRIGKLTAEKNVRYGDSVRRSGQILRVLWPDGIPPDKYAAAGILMRMSDKMIRIANFDMSSDDENPFDDVNGYALLGGEMLDEDRETVLPAEGDEDAS